MEFKAVCSENAQDANGLHHVTLTDSNGREVKFPSESKCEKGEAYTVSISGKGLDKPAPKPVEPAGANIKLQESQPIDKFDAQPEPK